MSENITQSNLELWDVDEAIKQITHDGLLDTIAIMNQPDYDLRQLTQSTISTFSDELRIRGMFNRAIKLGQINNPDTPTNWIAWAKRNDYGIDHLDCFINKQEINKPKPNNIPGKIPRIAIGRLAVTVAWEIERETGRRATAKEVLEELQVWAENGQKHSDVLHPSPAGFRGVGVYWITGKSCKKKYSLAACEKTLEKWNKSRQ
jgi:hypothetical protein